MKNMIKQELINDILTGLLVAATFALATPADVFAQTGSGPLSMAVSNGGTNVLQPIAATVSYISYGLGAVMVVAGIAGAKKHADAPGQNPLGPAIGKLGAGAAFLAAPFVVGMIQQTGNAVVGTGNSAGGTVINLQ